MSLAATTEEALSEVFVDTIRGLAPRITYKGGEAWKPYTREAANASTTRRFRIVWQSGGIQPGGAVGGRIIECFAEVRVRTDYAGSHEKQQFAIMDDFFQLQDELSRLKAPGSSSGVVLVTGERWEPAPEVDLTMVPALDSTDVVKIDHVFTVRYMRRISP